ncbi:MarR family winged helix-turn-helix transcriptional regulator [Pseudonocardia oroxyli]|uniref:DNA-binding transcriptional regulator, MarR family n=1 Tax=Pseudonocardia oroxyli TaxID=366584 RepID=A0A1G7UR85_PSEOR|nr:MarR family winged helix-turn-helix transcriptional regulator [Pseudonocardia oroxyli]SDG50135.1 DNA-binding transcriptional regulator, MarR family [Pseudonocardia oroxyli]
MNVGNLLFIPYRAMETEVMHALAEAGHGVLTLAQARVFQRIAPGGSRLTDLADQAQVTKQTAGVLVDQLQRAGYVQRVPDPSDGRARLVTFTDLGWRACVVANDTVAQIEARWADHLGDDMPALRRALTRLREITDPYAT